MLVRRSVCSEVVLEALPVVECKRWRTLVAALGEVPKVIVAIADP